MIIQRTSQVWTAVANLFCRRLSLGDNHFLSVSVERCARTLKIGAVFTHKCGNVILSIQRYFLPLSCSYLDSVNQILKTDYGYYSSVTRNN